MHLRMKLIVEFVDSFTAISIWTTFITKQINKCSLEILPFCLQRKLDDVIREFSTNGVWF